MPLGIPRLIKIVTVIGLASAPVALACMPALAVSTEQREWWLSALHVTQAWRTNHGTGVTVAVLADGVDATQADVIGSVVSGPDFTGTARHQGGPHFGVIGTGLASLIAGHGHGRNGASGVFGVAPGVKILSVRVTLSPGDPLWSDTAITAGLPDAIARGIRYAVRHGATVIDLPADPAMAGSAGHRGASAGGSSAERAAVAYAIRANVLLVAPAGDNARTGDAANYPAAYPGVISVGAFNQTFIKAPYSSRQPYVTLTAAGQGIVAAAPAGYQTMNSTWAASAIVAGVAALVRSQFPNLTVAQVSHALTSGTKYRPSGGRRDGSGFGTIDAERALSQAGTMSPPRARSAMFGALPRSRPIPPAVPSSASDVVHNLLKDAAISAGVLVALLVPITIYGSLAGRRERRTAQAAAERDRRDQTRSEGRALPADQLLEFFGPQHARPGGQPTGARSAASPRFRAAPSLAGSSAFRSPPWQTRADQPMQQPSPAEQARPALQARPIQPVEPAQQAPFTPWAGQRALAQPTQPPPIAQWTEQAPLALPAQQPPFMQWTEQGSLALPAQQPPFTQWTEQPPLAQPAQQAPFTLWAEQPPPGPWTEQAPLAQLAQQPPFTQPAQQPPFTPWTEQAPLAQPAQQAPLALSAQQAPVAEPTQQEQPSRAHQARSARSGQPAHSARSGLPTRFPRQGRSATPARSAPPIQPVPPVPPVRATRPASHAATNLPAGSAFAARADTPSSWQAASSGLPVPGSAPGSAPRPAFGSEPRPTVRQAPVSGAPPWEPAQEPTSELPWTAMPTAQPGSSRADSVVPPRPPQATVWHAAPPPVSAAPGSLFAPIRRSGAGQQDGSPVGPRFVPQSGSADPAGRPDTGSRPIYVWNPTATTDTFPAVNPDQP